MRRLRDRKVDRAIVAVLREPIDRPARPDSRARAASPPCRTPRPPHRRASGRRGDIHPLRARDRGWCGRPRRRERPPAAAAAVVQEERLDVTGEVVHGHERHAERQRDRLGRGDADEQRADEPGALRDRHGAEVAPRRARFVERALEHAADVANVLTRRELRHDAAPLAMDRDLRRDHARADRPRLRRIAGLLDDGGRRLVTRALDAEDHASVGATPGLTRGHRSTNGSSTWPRASATGVPRPLPPRRVRRRARGFRVYGAVQTPRSVMMPAM